MKKYFTSDWHLNDDRIGVDGKPNLFYRPFDSVHSQNVAILNGFKYSGFQDGDHLYHLGDVFYNFDEHGYMVMKMIRERYPKSTFTLIKGNYDDNRVVNLMPFFDDIYVDKTIIIKDKEYYLNHYPVNCIEKEFSLTGHIHGLWKVQKNMINVGVDAWHFRPISEDQIDFCRTAIEKYYNNNVFPY